MAIGRTIGDDRGGPVAELPREGGATPFILVQIQAGSPTSAAAQLRLASQPSPRLRLGSLLQCSASPASRVAPGRGHGFSRRDLPPKTPLTGPSKPFPKLRNLV